MRAHACQGRQRTLSIHGAAFSLIELVVVIALSAAVITVAVMAYQILSSSSGMRSSYGTVNVGEPLINFYGGEATAINTYFAPNFGRVAQAELLRDQFNKDLNASVAVFCLGRIGLNTIRPTTIPVSSSFQGKNCATPEDFRQILEESLPSSASVFTIYRGASTAKNASIFILKPSSSPTALSVLAVYEIDLTPATANGESGTYTSVRRYAESLLTDYYDVFYLTSKGTIPFNPLIVFFEQSSRQIINEGDTIDRLKQAAERPFYFIWWPNPASPTLETFTAPTYGSEDPRASYSSMGGRTPFFFAVPMFPAL